MIDVNTLVFVAAALLLGALLLRRSSRTGRAEITLGPVSHQWLVELRVYPDDR